MSKKDTGDQPKKKKRTWPWASWGLPSLGGALAGAALCVLVLQSQWLGRETVATDTLPASYVGLLSDSAGVPSLLASSTRHGRLLNVKLLQPLRVPEGQVARLYAGRRPRALRGGRGAGRRQGLAAAARQRRASVRQGAAAGRAAGARSAGDAAARAHGGELRAQRTVREDVVRGASRRRVAP